MRKRGILELGSEIPIDVRIRNFFIKNDEFPDVYYIGSNYWELAANSDRELILTALQAYDMNEKSTFTYIFIEQLIQDIIELLTERQEKNDDGKIIMMDFRPEGKH